mmetsp:Transcript_66323/g.81176  ORF Transcript_66323/g.81176 Transcript_66323/m.81176 type:complete len:162 (+) Transcript_66323:81-566(+)
MATKVDITGEPSIPATNVVRSDIPDECRRKHRRFKRCGCCLLVLNALLIMFISHKVCEIWWFLNPENNMILMPGGTKPFCNDFCLELCVQNDDGLPLNCDVMSCVNKCQNYFLFRDQDFNDDLVIESTTDAPQTQPKGWEIEIDYISSNKNVNTNNNAQQP